MAELDISQTTTPTTIKDFTVDSETTDGVSENTDSFHDNEDFERFFGKYLNTAKIKMAINAYANWVVGLGWTTKDKEVEIELDHIIGWGEDTFLSILWNMMVIKKVNGDSYAEIIRDEKTNKLINIKPLDPASIRIVVGKDGIIKRYEQKSKGKKPNKEIPLKKMLHFCNDRVADNIHGTSVIEAVEWNIEAQEEARRTHRKMLNRNGVVRIIELDTEDTTKRNRFKAEWKDAIEKGDIIILPKGVAEAKDWHGNLDTNGVLAWLNYLDDEFFQMIGIPKIIVGGSGQIEGDSKISYVTFEQIYKREVEGLIGDLWNQLFIKLEFKKPVSLKDELADNEAANTSQIGFQPNDTTAGVGV
ncbi:MAG: phage portal protein [Proteobacteria bacterium]|nr:phage portal protein [Pseudomonadota bacterium]